MSTEEEAPGAPVEEEAVAATEEVAAPAAVVPKPLFQKRVLKKGNKQDFPRVCAPHGCSSTRRVCDCLSAERKHCQSELHGAPRGRRHAIRFHVRQERQKQPTVRETLIVFPRVLASLVSLTCIFNSVVKAGVGKLIAGWDAALLTMSVGEKCLLTIPSEHGYGAKGKPPVIPKDATLCFEVELVNIMD